jgi:hypothetical protein
MMDVFRSRDDEILLTADEGLKSRLRGNDYLRHIIPALELDGSLSKKDPVLLELMSGEASYDCTDRNVRVAADFDKVEEGQLCFLMLHTLQMSAFRRSRHFVHGAAISCDDQSVLILGPSKMGKSTLTLGLALNDGVKVYGDDSVGVAIEDKSLVVDSGNTHVGVNAMHRDHRLTRPFYADGNPAYLDSRDLGLYADDPKEIKKVIFLEPDIFNTLGSRRMNDQRGALLLYEHVSRESRAAGYCLISDCLPLPSHETASSAANLLGAIKRSDIMYFSVSGGYREMLSSCRSIIRGEK